MLCDRESCGSNTFPIYHWTEWAILWHMRQQLRKWEYINAPMNYSRHTILSHVNFVLYHGDPTARLARNWFRTIDEKAFCPSALCVTVERMVGSSRHLLSSTAGLSLTNHSSTHIYTLGNQGQLPEVNYPTITRIHNRAKISVTILLTYSNRLYGRHFPTLA
jgi:hypothetical protein